MGYPTIQNFDIVFVKRTLENIENYNGEYTFTMLVNSLLGLIILPNEYNIKGLRNYKFDFLNQSVTTFTELLPIIKNDIHKFSDDSGKEIMIDKFLWLSAAKNKKKNKDIKLSEFLRRLRNGIAHFGIIPTKDNDVWKGIIIRNYTSRNKQFYCNFQLYLEESELRILSNFIANKYIANVRLDPLK